MGEAAIAIETPTTAPATGEPVAPASGRDEKGRFAPKGSEPETAPAEPETPAEGGEETPAGDPPAEGDAPETPAEPAKEPEPEPLSKRQLRTERKELDRYRHTLGKREASLAERERALAPREQQVNTFFQSITTIKDDPVALVAEVAKAAGWHPQKLYEAWTHRLVNDAPGPEELERRARAAAADELNRRQQSQQEANVVNYNRRAGAYIASDGFAKFPDLKAFTPQSLADLVTERVVAHHRATGVEKHVDTVLSEILQDPHTQALIAYARSSNPLLPGGKTGGPSERGGAAQAADHDPAKRPKTVSNRDAAQTSRVKTLDDMSDQERDEDLKRFLRARGFK